MINPSVGRTDAETEAPILGLPEAKSPLTGNDFNAGKDWGLENWATEDKMVGWHHWFDGHELEQTLGDGEGQGSLECCSPWGGKESDNSKTLEGDDEIDVSAWSEGGGKNESERKQIRWKKDHSVYI